MAKVLVVADINQGVLKKSTAELLSKAKAIGAETAVVAIGRNIESLIPGLVDAGSDTQYVADDSGLELFSAGPYASCVVDAAKQFGADLIWFGFSEGGKAVAVPIHRARTAGEVSGHEDAQVGAGVDAG